MVTVNATVAAERVRKAQMAASRIEPRGVRRRSFRPESATDPEKVRRGRKEERPAANAHGPRRLPKDRAGCLQGRSAKSTPGEAARRTPTAREAASAPSIRSARNNGSLTSSGFVAFPTTPAGC